MLKFKREDIEAAVTDVARSADIELVFNESDLFVIADSSEAINEFEIRLAAQTVIWEGQTVLDGAGMLRTLTDIHRNRSEFRPRRTTDEWQARYSIVVSG